MYKFNNGQINIDGFGQPTGQYPAQILENKIYRNRENFQYYEECAIHLSGPVLGRPKKYKQPDKQQNCKDECERVEVEPFSLANWKCAITARLKETAFHCIAM